MKTVWFLILWAILFLTSQGLFIFAGFPNPTGNYENSIDIRAANVWLYCALSFIIAILASAFLLYIIIKERKFILTSIIVSSILLVVMIAYTIFLYFISYSGWLGTYFNIASIFIDALIVLGSVLVKKKKISFKKEKIEDKVL